MHSEAEGEEVPHAAAVAAEPPAATTAAKPPQRVVSESTQASYCSCCSSYWLDGLSASRLYALLNIAIVAEPLAVRV